MLAHEAAFALGQMQDAEAIPALVAVLKDLSLHPIVRHEVFSEFDIIYMLLLVLGYPCSIIVYSVCVLVRQQKLLGLLAWKRASPCWRKV